jgi:hypothetical protein
MAEPPTGIVDRRPSVPVTLTPAITSVADGLETGLTQAQLEDADRAYMLGKTRMDHIGRLEEVANAALFRASVQDLHVNRATPSTAGVKVW